MENRESAPGGLYIHIPFCIRKCRYCDFYSITDQSLLPAYLQGLEGEFATLANSGLIFDTIYIGGGTPSLLSAPQVERLISVARRQVKIAAECEISLEVNPASVTTRRLRAYRRAGVNRLSVGVQSFQDRHLEVLGRVHRAAEAIETVKAARAAGFSSVSLDLIYGIFDQTPGQLQQDLDQAVALRPNHISAYTLTIEPDTPLGRACRQEQLRPLEDDQVAEMMQQVVTSLTAGGFRQYEISNFARPGHCSRHNQKYWTGAPYIGLGAAGHSFLPPLRYWNQANVKDYLEAIAAGRCPRAGSEILSAGQQLAETVLLRLRTTTGLDLMALTHRFGINLAGLWCDALEILKKQGLLRARNARVALTPRGMRVADAVTRMLLDKLPAVLPEPVSNGPGPAPV